MKILHTSHNGLPDHRIERAAYIAKSKGHRIEFVGLGDTKKPSLDVFDGTTMFRRLNNLEVVISKSIRKEWIRKIKEIDPDLIHANDIIAAQFSSMSGYPMVYDDHEYWSAKLSVFKDTPILRRITNSPLIKAIAIWEKDLLSKYVTITVNKNIAKAHRRYCDNVFVLQNFNLKIEVDGLPTDTVRDGLVYVGSDFSQNKFLFYRDLTGLRDSISFDDISGLPREQLYIKLLNYRFGLLPFLPVPYHRFANSAKLFDYLNCGLQVFITRLLYRAHGKLPFTIPFDDYSELPKLASEYPIVDPAEIMEYAHKNLVWEAQQDTLFEAYKIAMETG